MWPFDDPTIVWSEAAYGAMRACVILGVAGVLWWVASKTSDEDSQRRGRRPGSVPYAPRTMEEQLRQALDSFRLNTGYEITAIRMSKEQWRWWWNLTVPPDRRYKVVSQGTDALPAVADDRFVYGGTEIKIEVR